MGELGFEIFPGLFESPAEASPDRRIARTLIDCIEVKAGGSFPLAGTSCAISLIFRYPSP